MRKIHINLEFTEALEAELSADERDLFAKARAYAAKAYAPYSQFQVGAALLLENGEVVCGSNQENAAYPSGLCAERTAIYYAGATYPGVAIQKLAIVVITANRENDRIYAPCGSCRQAISEYEHRQPYPIKVMFEGPGDKITISESLGALLPYSFELKPHNA